jgi:hypothetical protein
MFLPLLCLGTILAPSCPASCQPSCSPPPSSGSIRAVWFHPFSRSTMSPMRSCAAAPRGRVPGSRPSGLAATSGSRFQTRWFLCLLLHRRCHATVPEPFSYPARRFLHAWDQRRLHSLHRRGTCPVSRHRPRSWTSDLFSSEPRPELGGSPVESCLCPWRQSNQSGGLKSCCTVLVYKPPAVL